MKSFNSKAAAITTIALAAIYMIVSLATGRTAASQTPPDLSAPEAAVDVWQASALLVREKGRTAVVDTRSSDEFALYHLPGSTSAPGASAQDVLKAAGAKPVILLLAETDAKAAGIAGQIKQAAAGAQVHFLKEGVRAWYLAYEIPVPLFADKPPPSGWSESMRLAKEFFAKGDASDPAAVLAAVGNLASSGYAASQLQGKKKAPAAAKKKISGGCGG